MESKLMDTAADKTKPKSDKSGDASKSTTKSGSDNSEANVSPPLPDENQVQNLAPAIGKDSLMVANEKDVLVPAPDAPALVVPGC